eukprot:COSAG01_NODE_5526_length_4205_cov_3.424744_3_plen_70_part_00
MVEAAAAAAAASGGGGGGGAGRVRGAGEQRALAGQLSLEQLSLGRRQCGQHLAPRSGRCWLALIFYGGG